MENILVRAIRSNGLEAEVAKAIEERRLEANEEWFNRFHSMASLENYGERLAREDLTLPIPPNVNFPRDKNYHRGISSWLMYGTVGALPVLVMLYLLNKDPAPNPHEQSSRKETVVMINTGLSSVLYEPRAISYDPNAVLGQTTESNRQDSKIGKYKNPNIFGKLKKSTERAEAEARQQNLELKKLRDSLEHDLAELKNDFEARELKNSLDQSLDQLIASNSDPTELYVNIFKEKGLNSITYANFFQAYLDSFLRSQDKSKVYQWIDREGISRATLFLEFNIRKDGTFSCETLNRHTLDPEDDFFSLFYFGLLKMAPKKFVPPEKANLNLPFSINLAILNFKDSTYVAQCEGQCNMALTELVYPKK